MPFAEITVLYTGLLELYGIIKNDPINVKSSMTSKASYVLVPPLIILCPGTNSVYLDSIAVE